MNPNTMVIKIDPQLISYQRLRQIVGVLGMLLPVILVVGNSLNEGYFKILSSISYYYYSNMGDVFTGILFAIGVFLFTYSPYRNETKKDSRLSSLACYCAIGVAIFPTSFEGDTAKGIISNIHFICAGAFFVIISYFALVLFRKTGTDTSTDDPLPKPESKDEKIKKDLRNRIYFACGIIMYACIFIILLNHFFKDRWHTEGTCFVFAFETIALWAFGFSWWVKGEAILEDNKKSEETIPTKTQVVSSD